MDDNWVDRSGIDWVICGKIVDRLNAFYCGLG